MSKEIICNKIDLLTGSMKGEAMTILTSMINDAIDKTQEFATAAKEAADKVIDEIQQQAPAVIDTAVKITEDMAKNASEQAPEILEDMKDAATKSVDFAKDVTDKTQAAVKETLEHASNKSE